MASALIVTKEPETAGKLQNELSKAGFTCLTAGINDRIVDRVIREAPQLVILELDGQASQSALQALTSSSRIRRKAPILVTMTADTLDRSNDYLGVDDFIVRPFQNKELLARARRLLQKTIKQEEVLRCGDLEIDLAHCEVRVQGKIVELTFKEYELLKFLAQDRGRVFTREALLNKVWGYDYFGGDRTVDVHIRRLRSKIEFTGQTFIETVRNIGYRFTRTC
jgi:DNA-binding response OmpR family regulator